MNAPLPEWLAAALAWQAEAPAEGDVAAALSAESPGVAELGALLSEQALPYLDPMAQRAQALTRRHFGRTMSLYAPLYLSNHCSGGCAYCGFASDRKQTRRRLEPVELERECQALKAMGLEEVLLLTGERTPQAGFDYLETCVRRAATYFHQVTVEAFPMSADEYRRLAGAGCVGVTVYQETYQPEPYARLHRWGPKRDFLERVAVPGRAMGSGMRSVGLGVLLGLSDPVRDAVCLFLHAQELRKRHWQCGISISFPRIRPQAGGFQAPYAVTDQQLAQLVFAFRICLPDVPLVLSTREKPAFRDGMAGLGISKMSVASRTSVGGYAGAGEDAGGQFEVSDHRDVKAFCGMLRGKGLDPVFKNWDAVYRDEEQPHAG